MKIAVESVEVATLKADGRPWDGPGRARVPQAELEAFFALDLDGQLARLVTEGAAPTPPDLFVRVFAGAALEGLIVETGEQKGFDAEWDGEGDAAVGEIEGGARLRLEVWDRDVLFHDLIGSIEATAPERPEGRWEVGAFGQVRRLVLRLA